MGGQGMDPERFETVIVGGGQAGLATGYHLARRGRPFVILDAGERVGDPYFDRDPDHRFRLDPTETVEEIRALFLAQCASSRRIVAGADLQDKLRPGTAFHPAEPHPALIWILFHVLQEYARHDGHLDVVRELADGTVGE